MRQNSVTEHDNLSRQKPKAVLSALPFPVLFAVIVIVSFAGFAGKARMNERTLCESIAFHASEEIAASLEGCINAGRALQAALETNPFLGKEEIRILSAGILRSAPYIIGVSTAPSAIVKFHFPEAGNEAMIGHDLLSNPERRDALTRAAEGKAPVVSGPFEAVDGGKVLFIRYPVFAGTKLWGFTSLTLDFGKMLESFALEKHYPGMGFAFSEETAQDGAGDIPAGKNGPSYATDRGFIGGRESVFNAGAVVQGIALPGAAWNVHVMPLRGWTAGDPYLYVLFVAGLMAAVLLFFIFYAKKLRKSGRETEASGFGFPASAEPSAPAGTMPSAYASGYDVRSSISVAQPPKAHQPPDTPPSDVQPPGPQQPSDAQPPEPRPREEAQEPSPVSVDLSSGGHQATEKNGRELRFKGPDVRGELFMPEVLFNGDPGSLFARAGPQVRVESQKAQNHSANDGGAPPQDANTKGGAPGATIAPKQEMLFPLQEQPESILDGSGGGRGRRAQGPNGARKRPATGSKGNESGDEEKPFVLFSANSSRKPEPSSDTEAAGSMKEPSPSTKNKLSILIVDDSDANRDIMGRMLTLRGYQADTARSGAEAILACSSKSYDIIFMDCFMPDMDGYKASTTLRSEFPALKTTIIGMSARVGEQELQRCTNAGMDDLLAKPFTLKELMLLIEKHTKAG